MELEIFLTVTEKFFCFLRAFFLSKWSYQISKKMYFSSIAKANSDIVKNTHSKRQEILEDERNKQIELFPFNVYLELFEKWMMGETSFKIYNSPPINNKIERFLESQQLKELDS